MIRTRVAGAAAVCAGLALLAGACGGGGTGAAPTATRTPPGNGITAEPASRIVTAANDAFTSAASAASVRMYGTVEDSGQKYSLDITMGPAGAMGSMTAPFDGARRVSVDLVLVHGKMYVRSSTLWRQIGAGAAVPGNRWVLLPGRAARGFPFANAAAFLRLLDRSGLGDVAAVGAKTTVDGQPAVEIDDGSTAVYVATTGQPYPLEIRQGRRDVLYLQYFSAPVTIRPPANPADFRTLHG